MDEQGKRQEDLLCLFHIQPHGSLHGRGIDDHVFYALKGLAGDYVTSYGIMTNFQEEGYDFYIAAKLREWEREHLEQELGNAEDAARFENIAIPAHTYVVCETERCKYPTRIFPQLRKRIVEEWLPSSGYVLAEATEVSVPHWFRNPDSEKRYMELWLPVSQGKG